MQHIVDALTVGDDVSMGVVAKAGLLVFLATVVERGEMRSPANSDLLRTPMPVSIAWRASLVLRFKNSVRKLSVVP